MRELPTLAALRKESGQLTLVVFGRNLPEQRQDILARAVGDAECLDAELLLDLDGLEPGRLLVHVGIDELADAAVIRSGCEVLRSAVCYFRGQPRPSLEHARQALERLPATWLYLRGAARFFESLALNRLGAAGEARRWLQEELAATENKVGFARQFYNDIATKYNIARETFPSNLIAGSLGFTQAELFEITDEAERQVPTVDLSMKKT